MHPRYNMIYFNSIVILRKKRLYFHDRRVQYLVTKYRRIECKLTLDLILCYNQEDDRRFESMWIYRSLNQHSISIFYLRLLRHLNTTVLWVVMDHRSERIRKRPFKFLFQRLIQLQNWKDPSEYYTIIDDILKESATITQICRQNYIKSH